jgi:DNA-damage-inducible protein D
MNLKIMNLDNDDFLKKFLATFEDKAQKDEDGIEFWYARDLQQLLEYEASWQNFEQVIEKAKVACEGFKQKVSDHFNDVIKMVGGGVAVRPSKDVKLTRYACYLIAQNADPRKKPVAFAQTYFAIQTRRKELEDIVRELSEDDKRMQLRQIVTSKNRFLSGIAKGAGVTKPLDHAIFQNYGYKGLYGGLDKTGIANRKGLSPKKDDILDHMGNEELGANIFRLTQTAAKIQRENITNNKSKANQAHYEVGAKVRSTIKEMGGTMPEELPTARNIKKIEQERKKKIKEEIKNQKISSNKKININQISSNV